MLFQTPEFVVLLLAVLVAILTLQSRRQQQWLLLVASYVFYGWWDVRFLVLILLSSLIDYAAALGIRGIRLSVARRVRISLGFFGFAALCLAVDWPAIQGASPGPLPADLFGFHWVGARSALLTCGLFAVAGPLLYELAIRAEERRRARIFVTTSIVANLGVLGFFKYYDFFRDNWIGFADFLGIEAAPPGLSVALPVGISFYTFQTMSYTIDVYRNQVQPERSLLRIALYVAYFPQLVAGPILRPAAFLPALGAAWTLRSDNLRRGFNLALIGLCKKVLIADRVAPLVDFIFEDPATTPSLVVMLGAVLFAVQIYCDFSGYTDIARGISRMFGVEIPLNFDFPYFSRSITEFWRRWHITLSTWLRDYLYIPLGGNRIGQSRTYLNLMATMVLGGLWHGASWNFVIWGAYQGGLLCLNRWLAATLGQRPAIAGWLGSRTGSFFSWALTLYLTLIGWIIFRVGDPDKLASALEAFVWFDGRLEVTALGQGNAAPFDAALALFAFVVLHAVGRFWRSWTEILDGIPPRALPLVYGVVGMLLFFLWPASNAQFIYFQF
ncbi:MAG: MBOAT family O-acyltransferase [Myxococcota bacterium]